jgi:regulator of sirC expression with transglutaminase-like and TPR domain
MLTPDSIQALINLLDDPDEEIVSHVQNKIRSIGLSVIPFLESAWENQEISQIHQIRIEQITHEIQFLSIKVELENWIKSKEFDLIEAWIILSKWQYPGIDELTIRSKIDVIRQDIWMEINDKQTAFEKVKILNKIFYTRYLFKGDHKNYHSPLNSFINTVLETKHGNPLSLSILYSTIAQSLNIPIYGVNLPNHFILAYMDENRVNQLIGNNTNSGVFFYINAFSDGSILYENDIRKFLSDLKLPEEKDFFEPCSHTTIVQRILINLISSYQSLGKLEKVKELVVLKEIILHA